MMYQTHELRLNCNDCHDFTEYYRDKDDSATVVRCAECGKRHSDKSIYMVDPTREYERSDDGTLLANLP